MHKSPAWRGKDHRLDAQSPFSELSRGSLENLEKSPSFLRPPLAARTRREFQGDFQVSEQTEQPSINPSGCAVSGSPGRPEGGLRVVSALPLCYLRISGLLDSAGASEAPWRGACDWPGKETRTPRQAAWASKPPWQTASLTLTWQGRETTCMVPGALL